MILVRVTIRTLAVPLLLLASVGVVRLGLLALPTLTLDRLVMASVLVLLLVRTLVLVAMSGCSVTGMFPFNVVRYSKY